MNKTSLDYMLERSAHVVIFTACKGYSHDEDTRTMNQLAQTLGELFLKCDVIAVDVVYMGQAERAVAVACEDTYQVATCVHLSNVFKQECALVIDTVTPCNACTLVYPNKMPVRIGSTLSRVDIVQGDSYTICDGQLYEVF